MTLTRKVKYTISQAANFMNRAIGEILDPSPTGNLDELWNHFGGRCVYCMRVLDPNAPDCHLDHAVPKGGNHIGNRVIACGPCNGNHKRGTDWQTFLRSRLSGTELERQEALIVRWIESNTRAPLLHSKEVELIRAELDAIVKEFVAKCRELQTTINADRQSRRAR